jgi:ATP-dependent helicase/nuclease subunit A
LQFTSEQEKAIDIDRLGQDACIVAGPGSGKTTVLVERYRRLVAAGIDPSKIVAITFTEKAAANMRTRLAQEFQNSPQVLADLDRAHVSTIHAFCSRLLRDHATEAAIDPEFTILDEQLGAIEQARALRETLDEITAEKRAAMKHLLDATNGADLESLLPKIYDALRAAGMRPRELRDLKVPEPPSLTEILAAANRYHAGFPAVPTVAQRKWRDTTQEWIQRIDSARSDKELFDALSRVEFGGNVKNSANNDRDFIKAAVKSLKSGLLDERYQAARDLLIEIIERFDTLYRDRKIEMASLDFNDLEFFTICLLEEHPSVRQQINQHFHQVMIDEFQDTSAQQARLVDLVRGPDRFYAVGDLNQSIYGFRHASPAVFTAYHEVVKSQNGHAAELVQNWRSRAPILRAVQTILHEAPGVAPRDLVAAREFAPREEPSVEVMFFDRGEDDEDDYTTEAAWVAARIQQLLKTHQARDIAILVRNSGVLDPYLEALERADIDYNLNRRTGFLETREARDLVHLLRMIENPRDERSTLAVLRSPFAGISDQGLLRMKMQVGTFGRALAFPQSVLLDAEDRTRFDRFSAAFQQWRAGSGHLSVDRLVLRALDGMGIVWDALSMRGRNIEKFLTIARGCASQTLAEFIDYLSAMRESDPRESDSPIDETRNQIQIMTTHAAKGLEFPVLFLAAMDKGMQNSDSSAINFTPAYGLGVNWSEGPGLAHARNAEKIAALEEAESHRLLYVALTRAEEHLILSWSLKPHGRGLKDWSKLVAKKLNLESIGVSDTPVTLTYQSPKGEPFDVRVLHTASRPAVAEKDDRARVIPPVVGVLERPELTGQFDPNVTATALSQFASCPRKYYLAGFLGWDGEMFRRRSFTNGAAEHRDAAQIGTEVHAMLSGGDPPHPQVVSVGLARVFERSSLNKRLQKAFVKEHEWDFVFGAGELIVRGTVDLWFEEPPGIVIVDYKTDDVSAAEAHVRADDYRVQIQVYGLALEAATGKRVREAWLYFLRPDVEVPVSLGTSDEFSILGADLISAQERLEFPIRPGRHCSRCEFFRNLCPVRPNQIPL